MTYYYWILILSLIIPFIFSFHSKVRFNKKFTILCKSIPLTSIFFIVWDIVFVNIGVWGFNVNYISNIYFYRLPLEEILFFIVIPFCCIYTYYLIEKFKINFFYKIRLDKLHLFLLSIFVVIGAINYSNIYTFFCFIFCALFMYIEYYYLKKISYNYFYTTFILLLIPFIIVNGALTGLFLNQTVVWYNPRDILGIYIFTIPIEDTIYAYLLILLNLIVYKYFHYK